MSYGIDLMFRYYPGGQLFERAYDSIRRVSSDPHFVDDFLRDNKWYIPSLRFCLADDKRDSIAALLDRYWLQNCLQVEAIIWPEYKLVGIVGRWDGFEKLGYKGVYFQNSCDQDYDFEDWQDICPMFTETVMKWQKADVKELRGLHPDFEDEDWLCTPDGMEYYRREAVYKEIFAKLRIEDFMYGNKNKPQSFKLSCDRISDDYRTEVKLKKIVRN